MIEPDAIASIVRDSEGKFHVEKTGVNKEFQEQRELQEALHGEGVNA